MYFHRICSACSSTCAAQSALFLRRSRELVKNTNENRWIDWLLQQCQLLFYACIHILLFFERRPGTSLTTIPNHNKNNKKKASWIQHWNGIGLNFHKNTWKPEFGELKAKYWQQKREAPKKSRFAIFIYCQMHWFGHFFRVHAASWQTRKFSFSSLFLMLCARWWMALRRRTKECI